MSNLYAERQSDGSYAVKKANNAIATARTQDEAMHLAHEGRPGVKLNIERIRDMEGIKPDKRRSG